jgi:hypothetical protein
LYSLWRRPTVIYPQLWIRSPKVPCPNSLRSRSPRIELVRKPKRISHPQAFLIRPALVAALAGEVVWKVRAADVLVALNVAEAAIAVEEEVTRPLMGLQRTAPTFPHPLPSTRLRTSLPALTLRIAQQFLLRQRLPTLEKSLRNP